VLNVVLFHMAQLDMFEQHLDKSYCLYNWFMGRSHKICGNQRQSM